jgi:K+-transporting ATPase A subunit
MTGFGFPVDHVLPSHVVGALSLLVLAIAVFARYGRRMAGAWRWVYAVTAMIAFYFNVFVLVVQLFQKVPALKALAPTQSEPPFAIVQLVVLAVFVTLTFKASIRFRPDLTSTAPARS